VAVRSTAGKGTTFELYLPLSDESVAPGGEVVAHQEPGRQTGTLLIIDDEESLRLIATDLLLELGYEVLQAEDGTDGVRQYGHHKDDVDLIILDMQMPGLSGEETFALLRQIDEQVPILLMSGYSREGSVEQLLHSGAAGFVQKPYRLAQLSQAVQQALADRDRSKLA
ncbi:MAG: response regulator, partial [Planctomycetota bacterium]